jgi:hypothetical protein
MGGIFAPNLRPVNAGKYGGNLIEEPKTAGGPLEMPGARRQGKRI